MDIQLIRGESPFGCYEDDHGVLRQDRRLKPDRRGESNPTAAHIAMRTTYRRKVDREIMAFLGGRSVVTV